jgi:drug/metabolite transporter (DMT)-like permease
MTLSRSHLLIVAAFASIYVLWGSTYLAVAIAVHSLPPFLLMGTRSIVGGAILLICAIATGGPMGNPKAWGLAALCGIFLFVGCHGVLAYAQQRVPSGLAAVILATIPFWIALLATVLPGSDRPSMQTLTLLVPGLAGVGLIAWCEVGASTMGPHIGDILLLLGASASWAVGTVLSKPESGTVSPVAFSGLELIAGGLVLLIIGAAFGEPSSVALARISASSVIAWVYLTIAGTVVAFAAYVWLLKQVPAPVVATYTFVNPIIAVLLGWAFLGERPSVWMIVGATMVIASVGGLLLARWKSTRKGVETWSKAERIPRAGGKPVEIGVGAPISRNSPDLGHEMV